MNTPKTLTRLDVVKGYEDNENVVSLFSKVMESRANEELFKNNILALCTYFHFASDTMSAMDERMKAQQKQVDAMFADIDGVITQALTKRRGELTQEAFARAFGQFAAEPQAPYGKTTH